MSPSIVLTHHAQERMQLRRISEAQVLATLQKPDYTQPSREQEEVLVSVKLLSGRKMHVVSKYLADENKTLVLSVWVRGEDDSTPLSWQLITLPFRAITWVGREIWKATIGKGEKL